MAQRLLDGFTRYLPERFQRSRALVPVVRLAGIIGYTTPLMPGMTLAGVARALERAFSLKRADAVALVINSPGGSAAQSHLIHTRVRALAGEHKKFVIAFVEDVAASGGYMIATAADEIVADPSSIIGSIGVVTAGFGFDRLIERIGIERRVYTMGERKVTLDPFQPEKAEDVKRLRTLQKDLHDHFIALVKERRGGKLKGPENALFSGEFWLGERALELGLIDRIGDLRSTLRERFGDKVITRLIAPPTGWFGRRSPGIDAEAAAGDWAASLISAIEARALWARYGL
jgi:serine protease SohB